jgi:cellulose synthase (UDP-forming)
MSLLIRYNAQRWLREPHETGLHLSGGILRIGTWWIYTLGFVYTLLRVQVPYIPTPKEDHKGNEWKLCLPNLAVAGLSLAAIRYGHFLNQTPYALLMMGLAFTNAAILGASVLMAQHDLLDSVVRIATTFRPIRWLVMEIEKQSKELKKILLSWIHKGALPAAFVLLIVHSLASLGISIWLRDLVPSAESIWSRSGYGEARVGYAATAITNKSKTTTFAYGSSNATPGLVELWLPPAHGPKVTKAVLKEMDTNAWIPLLTWEVIEGTFDDAEWQRSVAAIQQSNKPVLLRPLIKTGNAAVYRATWQRLVTQFRASGDTSAVWVWTVPRTDSLFAYFPGSAFTNWVAVDIKTSLPTESAESLYLSVRFGLAERVELNSKPVLVFAPTQPNQSLQVQTEHFTKRYPEVKGILFRPSSKLEPTLPSVQTPTPIP